MDTSETDAATMSKTLLNASDVASFALTCWLLALTSKAFTKFAPNPTAGNAVTAVFYAFGAAALVCVTTRLFQAHYKDHGTRLIS
jgi:hypothetical protein